LRWFLRELIQQRLRERGDAWKKLDDTLEEQSAELLIPAARRMLDLGRERWPGRRASLRDAIRVRG
jgi:hypothetical protein